MNPLAIITLWPEPQVEVLIDKHFVCVSCARCCRENKIPASEQDLLRMQENGIDLGVALEVLSPVLISSQTLTDARFKAYVLRQKPYTGGCAFLEEDNLCRIHDFKPLACKIYPFSVRPAEDGKVFLFEHPSSVCENVFVPSEHENRPGNLHEIGMWIADVLTEDVAEGIRLHGANKYVHFLGKVEHGQ